MVTAQSATTVTHCVALRVSTEKALVVAKGATRLEVYGIRRREPPILWYGETLFGRVSVLLAAEEGLLLVVTEQRQLCLLRPSRTGFETVSSVDLGEYPGGSRTFEAEGVLCAYADGLAACHVYSGVMKSVPIVNGQCGISVASRLSELHVISMKFVEDSTLATLHRDSGGRCHISTYAVTSTKNLIPGSWTIRDVDSTASHILSGPDGGLVVLGEREIGWIERDRRKLVRVPIASPAKIQAVCDIKPGRWFLADSSGRLSCVVVAAATAQQQQQQQQRQQRRKPKLQSLAGSTNFASCLAYLGSSQLFVGSTLADSTVVELGSDRILDQAVLVPNLGPIVDMCVVEPKDTSGQGAVVACCGTEEHGNLRVVRQGVDVASVVESDPPREQFGCPRNVWALGEGVVVITYSIPVTRAFKIVRDSGDGSPFVPCWTHKISSSGNNYFQGEERTLHCGLLHDEDSPLLVVQVTRSMVTTFHLEEDHKGISSWSPPSRPTHGASTGNHIVVACADASFWVLAVSLEILARLPDCEVSCLDAYGPSSLTIAWSSWSGPEVVSIKHEDDGALVAVKLRDVAKSVALAKLVDRLHLVAGSLGEVTVYDVAGEEPVARTRVSLGNSPVKVWSFGDGLDAILCAGDRAAIVASNQGKLECSAAHISSAQETPKFWTASCAAPLLLPKKSDNRSHKRARLDLESDKLSMVLAAGGRLALCAVSRSRGISDATAVKLCAQPRCVCHVTQAQLFAVGTAADLSHATKGGTFRFVQDAEPYDQVSIFDLDDFEEPLSCCCCSPSEAGEDMLSRAEETTTKLDTFLALSHRRRSEERCDAATAVVVLGTSILSPGEFEPSAGRLLAFDVSLRGERAKLRTVTETPGAVYDICLVRGSSEKEEGKLRFAVGVNHAVIVYDLCDAGFKVIACFEGFVVALKVASPAPDSVIVGDMMRSATLLHLAGNQLREVAKDFDAKWTSALATTRDQYLYAEASSNLVAFKTPTDDDRRLQTVAEMHLDQYVSCFAAGSLSVESSGKHTEKPLLFGSSSGMIGCVLPLEKKLLERLEKLNVALAARFHPPGNFFYSDWRKFKNVARPVEGTFVGFVDGDLVERFLDLSRREQLEVVQQLSQESNESLDVDDLVNDLAQLRQQH